MFRQEALRHVAVKAAMRPVGDAGYQSVLHGIVVDVIDMALKIRVVADRVLPIAALPNAFFALRHLAGRARFRSWHSA